MCSCQGDIKSRNLLLFSSYTIPPKIGLDWLNKNGNHASAGIIKKKRNSRKGRTKARLLFLNFHGRASMERTLCNDTWDLLTKTALSSSVGHGWLNTNIGTYFQRILAPLDSWETNFTKQKLLESENRREFVILTLKVGVTNLQAFFYLSNFYVVKLVSQPLLLQPPLLRNQLY